MSTLVPMEMELTDDDFKKTSSNTAQRPPVSLPWDARKVPKQQMCGIAKKCYVISMMSIYSSCFPSHYIRRRKTEKLSLKIEKN